MNYLQLMQAEKLYVDFSYPFSCLALTGSPRMRAPGVEPLQPQVIVLD